MDPVNWQRRLNTIKTTLIRDMVLILSVSKFPLSLHRIGSARRVTVGAALTNGELERAKFPPRLLAGDGDPDFGTPV